MNQSGQSCIQFCCMLHFLNNMSLHWSKVFPLRDTLKHTLRTHACMLAHCHKTLTDTIDPIVIAKTFASANDKGRGILGSSSKRRLVCLKQETRYVALGRLDWDISFYLSAHVPPHPYPFMEGYPM